MRFSLLFAIAVLVLTGVAMPQAAAPRNLTVLVKPAKPFAFEEGGEWKGYSVDLWRRISADAGYQSTFRAVSSITEVIDDLARKQADVGTGALSITAQREEKIDFTHGYHSSGLRVLVRPTSDSSIWTAVRQVFTGTVLGVIGVLLAALLINAHVLWLFERRKNPDSFPAGYPRGMWEALWWSVCTIITGGCENKAPVGVPGRLVAILWMLGCIGLTSFITANLSATLTTDKLKSDIRGIEDLASLPVHTAATVSGSAAAQYLSARKIPADQFDSVDAACDALVEGKVRAVVYDEPLLRYYVKTHPGTKLEVTGELREPQEYGFALQNGSPLRKEINRVSLQLAEEGFLQELDQKWFGDER